MKRWLRRFARLIRALFLLICGAVLVTIVVALGRAAVECRAFASGAPAPESAASRPADTGRITAGLTGYTRSEDQTYLTLPEWYIVYSADEYAAFIAHNPPSQFPYFAAVGQFWRSYYDVCAVTRDRYAFNSGYHLSLAVIGSSFTAENIIKGVYENTVGRFTEWTSSRDLTEEDVYAQMVAVDYGAFLHTIPWYEFPFGAKLGGLWTETHLWGPNMIRKWERKMALSLEYGTKALYGWLIRQGTRGVYSAEDLEIQVWVEGNIAEIAKLDAPIRIVKAVDDHTAIVALPRYEAFTQLMPRLARQGLRFVEIAGNDEILITALAPRAWGYDLQDGVYLFAMPILTQPDRQRVAIQAPVASLARVLSELESRAITVEHIYDY
jgi:hypothetical protein